MPVLPWLAACRSGVGSNGSLDFCADETLDAGSFFSGQIDNICIYDEVLSAEEVAELAR